MVTKVVAKAGKTKAVAKPKLEPVAPQALATDDAHVLNSEWLAEMADRTNQIKAYWPDIHSAPPWTLEEHCFLAPYDPAAYDNHKASPDDMQYTSGFNFFAMDHLLSITPKVPLSAARILEHSKTLVLGRMIAPPLVASANFRQVQ